MADNGIELSNFLEINTFLYDLDNKSVVKEKDLKIDKKYVLITEIVNKGEEEIQFKSIDFKLYDESRTLEEREYLIQKGYLENKIKPGYNYLVSNVKLKQDISKLMVSDNVVSRLLLNKINENDLLVTTILKSDILIKQIDENLFQTKNLNLLKNIEEKKSNIIFSVDSDQKLKNSFLSLKKENESQKETEKETNKETEKETERETEDEYIPQFGGSDIGENDMDNEIIPEVPQISVKNKPKLIVSNYKLTPEMVKAGEEFKLNLTFYNTNSEKSVRNIKITLNGSSSTIGANGEQASGSVFIPVNSSNTFYIRRIDPEYTVSKEITLKTPSNVQAQNYSMEIRFEYEDADGNEFTANEVIGVPVVQASKILYGDVTVSEGFVGQPVNLNMDFYNIGKDTLTTFMVTVEGNDFTTSGSQRYFVGNFAPGSSDNFNTDIIPNKSGEIIGNVIITYEDSTGTAHKEEIPFKAQVEEEIDVTEPGINTDEVGLIDDNMGYTPLYQRPSLWIGLAIVIIIIAYFARRRAKKKKDKEFLDLNE